MERDRYWVALFNEGGEYAGVQRELARCSQPKEAHLKYREYAEAYPNRLVMLIDRATVICAQRPSPNASCCVGPWGAIFRGHLAN
jgi:hypothetical protein